MDACATPTGVCKIILLEATTFSPHLLGVNEGMNHSQKWMELSGAEPQHVALAFDADWLDLFLDD